MPGASLDSKGWMKPEALAVVAAITAIVLPGCVPSPSQKERVHPEFAMFRSPRGAVVVWNEAPAHFTVELPGTHFGRAEQLQGASFVVDGRMVQVFTVRIDYFARESSCWSDPLRCYEDWEVAYRRSKMGAGIGARELASPASGFFAWEVDVPPELTNSSPSSVTKQVYVTRVVEHVVLVLSCSVTKAEPAGSGEAYLADLARSLRVSKTPIDAENEGKVFVVE